MKLFILLAVTLGSGDPARASDAPDPKSLYEISTAGTSKEVKRGAQGTWVLAIRCKPGAHVSDEAPLRIDLAGRSVTPAKPKLTLADSVAQKAEGKLHAEPRFEVPFVATQAGQGGVDAKLSFFICTENLCARQTLDVTSPVQVRE